MDRSELDGRDGIIWIKEHGDAGELYERFLEQLEAFPGALRRLP
jgi:hypothetical protein